MTQRIRKISVLIDGEFFLRRLPKCRANIDATDPEDIAKAARQLCKRHVQRLTGEPFSEQRSRWLDHVYRLFYYDGRPWNGMKHHPTANRQINFGKSDRAKFSDELFKELRKARKFALRLGEAQPDGEWRAHDRISKKLLKIHEHATYLESVLDDPTNSDDEKSTAARVALGHWTALQESDVVFPFRQKGVDMRIGLDIAAMTLKRQVDTIILVTGDADFIPAAKLARREGVEFLLDPMWQSVNDDLLEHIDGLQGGFDRPGSDSEPEDNDE